MRKKTKNVAKALLVLRDKAKNIRVELVVCWCFNNTHYKNNVANC